MLIGFAVKNYKSFEETQKLSMLASLSTRHESHVVHLNDKRILKSGLLFGANASGKTNLIKAITFSKEIVLNGLMNDDLKNCSFNKHTETEDEPGVFQYALMIDGIEYEYGIAVSYKQNMIIGEWLTKVENEKESCVFNRYVDEEGISYVESDYDNGNDFDSKKMKFYFDGFGKSISKTYRKKTILNDIALREHGRDGIFKEVCNVFAWFSNIVVISLNSKSKRETCMESEGTLRLNEILSVFKTNQKDRLILIDELDRSLHTHRTRQLLEVFYANTQGQMIATTHDTNLLDLDLMRQDEIWFMERLVKCSSSLYSLNQFKLEMNEKVKEQYLLGRYGALPQIDDLFEVI